MYSLHIYTYYTNSITTLRSNFKMSHSSLYRKNYYGASRVCHCWTNGAPKVDYEDISRHEAQPTNEKTGPQEGKEAREATEKSDAKPSIVESAGPRTTREEERWRKATRPSQSCQPLWPGNDSCQYPFTSDIGLQVCILDPACSKPNDMLRPGTCIPNHRIERVNCRIQYL